MIETVNRFIPIEVKIYANDQYKQCYDYYQKARNSNVYYLTLFGDLPSDDSAYYEADGYKKINEFYRYSKTTYPGISYLYKSNVKKNTDIWVRIEIEHRIFIGYCCPVNEKQGEQPLTTNQIKEIINFEPRIDNWWAYWELIPDDDENRYSKNR